MGQIVLHKLYPDSDTYQGQAGYGNITYQVEKIDGQTKTPADIDNFIRSTFETKLLDASSSENMLPLAAKISKTDRVHYWKVDLEYWTYPDPSIFSAQIEPTTIFLIILAIAAILASGLPLYFVNEIVNRAQEIIWGPAGSLPLIPIGLALGGIALVVTSLTKFKLAGGS